MKIKRTHLCPKCQGIGLIETKGWGRTCHMCFGRGRVIMEGPYKVSLPTEKTSLHSLHKGERDNVT